MTDPTPFPTSIRLPGTLRDRIDVLRDQERRSLNAQIIVLLEEAVASRERGGLWVPDEALRSGGSSGHTPETHPNTTSRTRPKPCPHRVPTGSFCKRCQRVV